MEINQDLNKPVDDNSIDLTDQIANINQEQHPVPPEKTKKDAPTSCDTSSPKSCEKKCCNRIAYLVLLLAVVVLYILHFTGAGCNSKHDTAATAAVPTDGALKVAYVNSDTLLAKYEYARELEKGLIAYKETQENNYRSQMTQFQKDYQDFLQNGDKLSLSQQQAKEAELKQRAEKLSTLEAELTLKIQNKQIEENTKLLNAIFGFIKEYNEANQQYDIILRKTFNDSPTLYMNEGMDITQEIIDGLNEEYKNLKK